MILRAMYVLNKGDEEAVTWLYRLWFVVDPFESFLAASIQSSVYVGKGHASLIFVS